MDKRYVYSLRGVLSIGISRDCLTIYPRIRPFEYQIWTSSAQVASHGVLLARTSEPRPDSRSSGLSLFFAPIRESTPNSPRFAGGDGNKLRSGIEMHKIDKMGGNAVDANEVWSVYSERTDAFLMTG